MENDIEKRTVHPQLIARLIINKSQFPKIVHKKTDPRPGCADHLSEDRLTDLRNYGLVLTFLAEMSQQQQQPGQSFLARIKS